MNAIPPNVAGSTWTIDTTHSEASFTVRHAAIAKVRGTVAITSGAIEVGETLDSTRITAQLDPAAVTTGDAGRDGHLKTADFFEVETYPTWTFASTGIKQEDEETYRMTGDLTIHGVTKPVDLEVEFNGTALANGSERAGFSATTQISRKEFGLTWNAPIEAGGVLVSDKVVIGLEIEAVRA